MKCENKDKRRAGKEGVHWSPYGCHNHSPIEMPQLDVEIIPKDGLKAGEQYFVDLAGNVKKVSKKITLFRCDFVS